MPHDTSPQTSTRPSNASPTTGRADTVDTRSQRPRLLGLSFTQVLGGSLAATTAAFLGARLGLAGTLAGAATASVVSAIVSAAYVRSIDRTRHFIRTTRVVATSTARRQDSLNPATPPREVLEPAAAPRLLRLDVRRVGLASLAVLAATLVAVTGYEFVSGHALDGQKGTTVSQVVRGGAKADTTSKPPTTPSATATATATVTVTTTAGATAPSDSPTSAPSSTAPTTSVPPVTTGLSTAQPTDSPTTP